MGLSDRFPQLAAYLDALPDGLESYPECQSKGALLRSAVDGHHPAKLLPGLPPSLQAYVNTPPSHGLWTPAVHADAMFYAVCDRYYPTEDEMLNWIRARTATMSKSALYRALLRVSSPRVLFGMTAKGHGLFQRGTLVANEVLEAGRVVARLRFPRNLHTRGNLISNVGLYEALATLTGATDAHAQMLESDTTSALFECTWS